MRATSASPEATRRFGRQLGALLAPGDVLVLIGDLGAGKTLLVQSMATGLGITERVTSPTFALVHHYDDGRVPVVHIDAWRLDSADDLIDLGVEAILDDDRVTIVEWGDRVTAALPAERLELTLTHGDSSEERHVQFDAIGRRWDARRDALLAALGELGSGT